MTELLKPPSAAVGVKAAVISPASTPEQARVERGMEALEQLGFEPVAARHALTRGPLYFAGTEEQRLKDLNDALADDAVRVVFATRGGYWSNYLLEGLDLDLVAAHPKPIFGYSDLTAVQVLHSSGWSESSTSIAICRSWPRRGVLVSTSMPSAAGRWHEAG